MATITELKQLYIKSLQKSKVGKELTPQHLRMFYMGRELKDDLFVYTYEMKEDLTIQALIRQKI